jgi:hypothetical protein
MYLDADFARLVVLDARYIIRFRDNFQVCLAKENPVSPGYADFFFLSAESFELSASHSLETSHRKQENLVMRLPLYLPMRSILQSVT